MEPLKKYTNLAISFAIGVAVGMLSVMLTRSTVMLQECALLLPLASFWIFGFRAIFQPGMILGNAGDWLEIKMPDWLFKPLIQCPACMASIHGSLIYWIAIHNVWLWIPFIVCLSGLNYLLTRIIYE